MRSQMMRMDAVAFALIAVVLTACSGQAPSDSSEDADGDPTAAGSEQPSEEPVGASEDAEPFKVNFSYVTATQTASVLVAQEQGFFAEENLEVELIDQTGGVSELMPLLLGGDLHVITSGSVPTITAAARGIGAKLLASTNIAPADGSNAQFSLMVREDAPFESFGDFEGRLGINAIGGGMELYALEAIELDGGDLDAIESVELPFPSQVSALIAGDVDAIHTFPPFSMLAADQGARALGDPFVSVLGHDTPQSFYVVSEEFANENPDVVERLIRALERGAEYANDNPDGVRESLRMAGAFPEELVDEAPIPEYSVAISEAGVQRVVDLMIKHGIIESAPPFTDMVTSQTPVTP